MKDVVKLLLICLIAVRISAQDLASCSCIAIHDPVCGVDGKEYGNKCLAGCNNVEIECEQACPCPQKCIGPLIRCAKDPCEGTTCPAHPDAKCVQDYCTGCNYYYEKFGKKVNCERPGGGCICTKEYRPVCGINEKTYGNRCEADCDNVDIECEQKCPCPSKCDGPLVQCIRNPCDGTTCPAHPDAKCVADYCKGCNFYYEKFGKKVDCELPGGGCICTREYRPVCGVNKKTYSNRCEADCDNVDIICEQKCPCPAACPEIYAPVCGVDGQKYDNECLAKAAGVKVACKGQCPCKPECDGTIFNCFVDPCRFAKCEAYPGATCKSNYCNGCNAEFYYKGQRVECDKKPPNNGCKETDIVCIKNACDGATCAAYPQATCKTTDCNGCIAEWYYRGQRVECDKKPPNDGCVESDIVCIRNACIGATCAAYPQATCKTVDCNGCIDEWYYRGRRVDCNEKPAPPPPKDGFPHSFGCRKEGNSCTVHDSGKFKSFNGDDCCQDLQCCTCVPVEREGQFIKRGTCQKECNLCRG